ncbi:hypothetical protein GCM10028833_03230 [Glycomyces tarimensis]
MPRSDEAPPLERWTGPSAGNGSGSLRFTTAATRVTELLAAEEYLSNEGQPDADYAEGEELWLLSEWLHAVNRGYGDSAEVLFESADAAERYFADLARSLTDGSVNR